MLILTNILDWNYFWIGLWIFIFVFALIIEFATPQLVSIWFSGASLISFILALFKVAWWIQLIAFISISIILVAFSRKFVTKILQKDIPTNSDALIGQEILVVTPVSKHKIGSGKIRDITWSLYTTEETIEVGEYAIITSIEGNKLHVKRKEN